ncbi:hypothetical protein [Oceanobacillus neutriphilus]|uniref:Uncharacterized protein n=1 Tax=Oceanobacillus neutriphilus TaxID=531815 RepID=A0ABQ2P240_9BACI|nr:hypothetical protein [Oceanobacillus neutriphilus]GGP16277.1 hypothetical protein GCM10011346_47610 [Oceanobacillus neutriphilus]
MCEDEVQKRKSQLIKELHRMEIYQTSDGRNIDEVRLYTLEWTYIEALNGVVRNAGY